MHLLIYMPCINIFVSALLVRLNLEVISIFFLVWFGIKTMLQQVKKFSAVMKEISNLTDKRDLTNTQFFP